MVLDCVKPNRRNVSELITKYLAFVATAAMETYVGENTRIWYAKHGSRKWQAYLIRFNYGDVVKGPICKSPGMALSGLGKKIKEFKNTNAL
jgi:hypothetical protein